MDERQDVSEVHPVVVVPYNIALHPSFALGTDPSAQDPAATAASIALEVGWRTLACMHDQRGETALTQLIRSSTLCGPRAADYILAEIESRRTR